MRYSPSTVATIEPRTKKKPNRLIPATKNFFSLKKDKKKRRTLRIVLLPTTSSMTESTRLKSTIYVGGLDAAVTASTLHAAFIPFGDISSITLPKPELPSEQARSPHRGFGYVEFEDAADASEAMDNMDHAELFGRVIRVAPAKPAKDPNEGLGSKTAVWEQVGLFQFSCTPPHS
ncbi:hypothetical protein BDY21DRAFT_334768 [Lineolata rhizophorae]|uniref:RRM domain-containing protein n=1 Tax=Lineolata rhizophorae TaxID=578093 RepID=A0A6A6P8N4_9PEZI|nr:hypothetical protein BDY21DRAFT_334768 [Lineolata rhizophorae]